MRRLWLKSTIISLLLLAVLSAGLLIVDLRYPTPGLELLSGGSVALAKGPTLTPTASKTSTATKTATASPTASSTVTVGPTATATSSPTASDTPESTATASATPTPGATFTPWPGAPACPAYAHDPELPHGVWNGALGCHYDHEHGADPLTAEVAARFPGFLAFLCGQPLSACNQSGPGENTLKHGGNKWQVQLSVPHAGELDFEGAPVGICGDVIKYHVFGDERQEAVARFHSITAFLEQCIGPDDSDPGLIYATQLGDLGQFVVPYQGVAVAFDGAPEPYDPKKAPYNTADCFGAFSFCRISTDWLKNRIPTTNNAGTWTSKCFYVLPCGSRLVQILFRVRDAYQLFDYAALPAIEFRWVCSTDQGLTYAALAGCPYNNSTSFISEISGEIPAEWDNLTGFDTDPDEGRITAQAQVTRFGQLAPACVPGGECFPIWLHRAYVGHYGAFLGTDKLVQWTSAALPDRDQYFCSGQPCAETDAGAVSSGWLGQNN